MKYALREYQSRSIETFFEFSRTHSDCHPLLVLPTGSGKSVIVAEICKRVVSEWNGRVIMVVRSKELCEQNLEKLLSIWPAAPVGVHSAAMGKKDIRHQVLYSTIGSIYKKAHLLGRVDMLLIDEAHMVDTKQSGIYRQFIADLHKHSPHMICAGLTATPYRGNGIWLTAGESPLFTHIATEVKMQELLEAGHLAPLTPAPTDVIFSSEGIRKSGDDFMISDLAAAHDKDELVHAACAELVRIGQRRQSWIVFGVTIQHCEHIRDKLQSFGIDAEIISAETDKHERAGLIKRHRAGTLRVLVSVNALAVGFDSPRTDLVCLMRSTNSPNFYVQSAGRGMRPSPGTAKTDCLWVDFTDTTERMGPVDAIKGRVPTAGRKGVAPTKLCPECGNPNPTAAPKCIECGFEFPPPERIKHGAQASAAAVLSSQVEQMMETVPVDTVQYRLHEKAGSPPSLRVEYYAGMLRAASEWVCVSHSGYARVRAEQWWQQRTKIDAIPGSTEEALEWLEYDQNILRVPAALILNKQSKYPTIVGFEWEK